LTLTADYLPAFWALALQWMVSGAAENGPLAGIGEVPGGTLQFGLAISLAISTKVPEVWGRLLGGAHCEVMVWSGEDVWL